MVTDTIGDFIIRIKNANLAKKDLMTLYNSKMKFAIAEALVRAGYIKSVSKNKNSKMIEIALEYKSDKSPKITNVDRISKPSRRIYNKSSEIKFFKNNENTIILSTPKGILSNKEAHKQGVGGEVLFKIW